MNLPFAKEPLRVLHCLPALGGGGTERQLAFYVTHSDSPVIQHGIFAWRTGVHEQTLRESRTTLFLSQDAKKWPLTALFQLVQAIRVWRPHLIHTWLPHADVIMGVVGKLMKVPVIGSERSNRYEYESRDAYRGRWFTFLRPWVYRHCILAAVTNSEAGARYIEEALRADLPVKVIRNGIDHNAIGKIPPADLSPLELSSNLPIIVTASRLVALKRIDVILEALVVLKKQGVMLNFLVCGEGPLYSKLTRDIHQLGLKESVRLLGYRPDVISIMKAADVFCSASMVEGLPNAVLEAMMCGLPILASDIEAHRNLLDGRGAGILFEQGSVSSLAENLARLVASPSLRKKLGQQAKRYSQEFTIERMCAQYDAFYLEAYQSIKV